MSLKQKVGAGVARIIAFVNQKGGVGKTTSAVNLTAALHAAGRRVLLCDFDPQANATSGLGVDKGSVRISTYDLAVNEQEAKDAVVHTKFGDLLPSNPALSGAGVELVGIDDREHVLKRALDPLRPEYDYIFIDCPPSLELLTLNALCAADQILIPVQCEYYALEGLSDLMTTLRAVKRRLNPDDVRRADEFLGSGGRGGTAAFSGQGLCGGDPAQRAPCRGAEPRAARDGLRPVQPRGRGL